MIRAAFRRLAKDVDTPAPHSNATTPACAPRDSFAKRIIYAERLLAFISSPLSSADFARLRDFTYALTNIRVSAAENAAAIPRASPSSADA